jgi:hypothetical protein
MDLGSNITTQSPPPPRMTLVGVDDVDDDGEHIATGTSEELSLGTILCCEILS